MTRAIDDNGCFVCGRNNPHGLHLSFSYQDDQALCHLSIPGHYQGWQGIIHGGIVATLLDEIMAKAAHHAGYMAVTADISVQYRKPTPAGTPLLLKGRLIDKQHRIVLTEGELCAEDGTLLASAKARFFIP